MTIRVYDRSTAARMLRQWRVLGGRRVRVLSRGVAWCGRLGRERYVLALMTAARRD